MSFNRNDDFDASSYVKVNVRLKQFRDEHKESSIITERMSDERGVTYRTMLFRNLEEAKAGIPFSTGHSFLDDGIRGDKVEEFTETVSVGRALALAGYSVEKSIATGEEMVRWDKNKKKASEPKPTPSPETPKEASPQEEDSVPPTSPPPKLKASNRFKMNKLQKSEEPAKEST